MIKSIRQNDIEINNSDNNIIDYLLTKEIGSLTLTGTQAINDKIILVTNSTNVTVGEYLILKENKRFFQAQIISKEIGEVTIDSPLDFAFTVSAIATHETAEMNVDGSLTTEIFCLKVPASSEFEITRSIFIMENNTAMNSQKFGGLDKLTNGLVFRQKNGSNKNLLNWKTDGDFAVRAFDLLYDDRSIPNVYAVKGKKTWNGKEKNDVIIKLVGNNNDEFQALVQDDLLGLTKFNVVIQGKEII